MNTTSYTFRILQLSIFTLLLFIACIKAEAAVLITPENSEVDYFLFGRDQNADGLDDSDFISEGTHTNQFAGKFSNAIASDWITLQNNAGDFSFNGSNGVDKRSWMGSTLNFDIKFDQSYNNTYVPKIIIVCMNGGNEKKYTIEISDQVDINSDTWQNVQISFTQEEEVPPTTNAEGVITGGEYQNLFANNIVQNAQRFKAIKFTTYLAGTVTQAKFQLRDMHLKGTFEWETKNTSFVHKNENGNDASMTYRYSKKASLSETGKLPAFIFLHGNGGGDNALGSDAQWSLYERPIAATKYSTYIFEPKSGYSGGSLSDNQINKFLDHIIADYDVDPNRIYLGGFSAGGIETSRYLTTAGADRLAAAYFINGAMLQSLKNYQKMDWSRATDLSTWIINNLNDTTVPHYKISSKEGSTSRLNNVLVANGANVVLRLHETGGHSIKIPRNFTPSFLEFIYSSKIASVTTWNGSSWSNGTPTTSDKVVLSSAYTGTGFKCSEITIDESITTTITGGTLEVTGDVTINGNLIINSGASLLTYEGNTFTGNVQIQRNTRHSGGQYSFVGTTVKQSLSVLGNSLGTAVYKYDETKPYGTNEGLERWVIAKNEELTPGRGYTQAFKKGLSFVGKPNDGTVTYAGTYTDRSDTANDGWNLVANPYPTGIDINDFLTTNSNIDGAVYIWDDNGSDTERGTSSDYIVINGIGIQSDSRKEGSGRLKQDGGKYILGAGQGFFVKITDELKPTAISFTESMRRGGLNHDDNFFRQAVENKQLLRISLENKEKTSYSSTLIGFLDGATQGVDRLYDALQFSNNDIQIYSRIADNNYAIQGLPLLSNQQMIPLGMNILAIGQYSISIEDLTNIPENTLIELIDTDLDKVYNLSENGSYTFIADKLEDNNRFVLKLTNQNTVISGLNIEDKTDFNIEKNGIILSKIGIPTQVHIMDMSGKLLLNKSITQKDNQLYIPYTFESNRLYIIKVNGIAKKVIF